jgi:hypothetical protein
VVGGGFGGRERSKRCDALSVHAYGRVFRHLASVAACLGGAALEAVVDGLMLCEHTACKVLAFISLLFCNLVNTAGAWHMHQKQCHGYYSASIRLRPGV